jgi:hypothetical protein
LLFGMSGSTTVTARVVGLRSFVTWHLLECVVVRSSINALQAGHRCSASVKLPLDVDGIYRQLQAADASASAHGETDPGAHTRSFVAPTELVAADAKADAASLCETADDIDTVAKTLPATTQRALRQQDALIKKASSGVPLRKLISFTIDAGRPIQQTRKGGRILDVTEVLSIREDDLSSGYPAGGGDDDGGAHKDENDADVPHAEEVDGTLKGKDARHDIFAEWLIRFYGRAFLSTGSGVLDVAGGKGGICFALHARGVPAVLLEPKPAPLSRKAEDSGAPAAADEKSAAPPLRQIVASLHGDGSDLADEDNDDGACVRTCSIVVGMHSDQATEPIVRLALKLGVPFAVRAAVLRRGPCMLRTAIRAS